MSKLDESFQKMLVAQMLNDERLTEQISSLVGGEWKAGLGEQQELWWIAQQAAEYREATGEALGRLAVTEIQERAGQMGWSADRCKKLAGLTKELTSETELPSGKALMIRLKK